MKRKLFGILLLLVLVVGMAGCGKKASSEKEEKVDMSKYAGTYVGQYTKFVGDETKTEDEEFSVVLEEDGTGKSTRDGNTYNMTWSIKGSKFEMTEKFMGITIDYTGTLKDGKIDVFNGDPDNDFTVEYVYEKE